MNRHRKKSRKPNPAPSASPPSEPAPQLAYQCQAVAHDLDQGTAFAIGAHIAATPRLALRWLHERARAIADQLDPPAAQPIRHWLTAPHQHERALATLRQGHTFVYATDDDTVRYTLTAQPVTNIARPATASSSPRDHQ